MNQDKLDILFEDEVIIVCNKPAGLMVEPDRNNFPNLQQQVKQYLKEKTGEKLPYAQHLHRIDRPVSGVVLFTKNKDHLRHLSEQFAQREVKKYYLAVTEKASETLSGTLENWHRKEKKKAVIVPEGTEYAEKATLKYEVKPFGKYFLWEIELHTGKYHQIRVQLANIGCPIIGDETYGSTKSYLPNSIALQAYQLIIQHPVTNETIKFEADPQKLTAFFK